jgi:hypothetical protein
MTVAGLFGSIALAALLTGISIVGRDTYQSPPRWVWFALAGLDSRRVRSKGTVALSRTTRRTTSDEPKTVY